MRLSPAEAGAGSKLLTGHLLGLEAHSPPGPRALEVAVGSALCLLCGVVGAEMAAIPRLPEHPHLSSLSDLYCLVTSLQANP